ncbi:MAG: hypothetical protein LBP26_04180 [Clostridiales bacterium]|nr:hypothetical protein [Clostridiales bacterium]
MFFGEYRHQLDEKCRIRIPAKLREDLGEKPFVMRGPNHSLIVLREADANAMLTSQFGDVDMVDPSEDNFTLRMLTSSAFFAEEDKQGRILLPNKLLEHAGFKKKGSDEVNRNAVTIGALNRIEIWCESVWDGYYGDVPAEEFDKRLSERLKNKRANGGVKN